MYNSVTINSLVKTIEKHDGINDKQKLTTIVQDEFGLVNDRSVYYCKDFAIRFSRSARESMGNTVLSLSCLRKYDNSPIFVCIVTPKRNYMLLINSTLIAKISHSSRELRVDNIKGSFNGSDIMRSLSGLENIPANFPALYTLHESFTFEENLTRLVEATNGIVGTGQKFTPSALQLETILEAPTRALQFSSSPEHQELKTDLVNRARRVQTEIAIAAFIDNVNIRGRIIEYLVTSNGGNLKEQLTYCLRNKTPLPEFKTDDSLGDYIKRYESFNTATDIKTKVLFLDGNPKAYNIDKLLSFLAEEKSVYMVFLIGINENGSLEMELCSVFQSQLMNATVVMHHWAGRNSRGVTQFYGNGLVEIIRSSDGLIDITKAEEFVSRLVNL